MRAPLRTLALALAITALFPPHARAGDSESDPHALAAQVLEAYGGRPALEKVHAYRMEGTLFNLHRHEDSPTIRVFERPDRLKVLIGYEDAYEVRIVDGEKGWRNAAGGPTEPASGMMLDAMRLQAARTDVPWILAERANDVRWVSEENERERMVDSVRTLGLEIPLGEGQALRLYVDPESHLVKVSRSLLNGPESSTWFETRYSDFREVDGIRFAFHEDNWASGVQTAVTTVSTVKLNPKLKADEFRSPGEAKPGGAKRKRAS